MIWTSRDGVTWQRMTAAQLGLAGPGETVQNISYATSRGNATVISGTVSSGTSYDAAWLSTNGGTAWTRVTIPADHGAGTAISGLAFDGSGLIAVRPGRTASGAADGIAYFSPNGQTWQYTATIDPAGRVDPRRGEGQRLRLRRHRDHHPGQLVGYTSTGTGTSWLPTGPLGSAAAESVVGATVAPGGTIVAVGYTAASKVGQQPVFLEASTDGTVRSGPAGRHRRGRHPRDEDQQHRRGRRRADRGRQRQRLPGGVAEDDGQRLDAGLLAGAGRGRLAPARADQRDARAAGWLAVGAPGPVVLTSADGAIWGVAGGNIAQDLAGVSAVAATSGPAGYVIVGKLVAPGGSCVADVWWSANLTSWTRAHDVNDADGSSQVLAVAASAHGFVSVGSHDGQPAVWTTADGRAWKTIVLPPPAGATAAALQQVAINGNRVVALGQATTGTGPAVGSATGTVPVPCRSPSCRRTAARPGSRCRSARRDPTPPSPR